jgi:hypothetical protein
MELLGDDWYKYGDWGIEFDEVPSETTPGEASGNSKKA